MKYRSDIDGLRAVAVLTVVLFHAGLPSFSGGYVGVDVFFVISGFLITTIIWNEVKAGKFSIANFYERRLRRIFPALFFVLSLCYILAAGLLLPEDFERFGKSLISAVFFGSNLYFWRTSNYFSPNAEEKPLLHTWSLAVEEQFYLFVPFLLMYLYAALRNRAVFVISVLFVISLTICLLRPGMDQTAAFYLLPTRAWELFTGSLIALAGAKLKPAPIIREGAAALGLAGIIGSVALLTPQTVFPGIATIFPVFGAGLIIWAGQHGSTFIGRALSIKPMVFIGLISYSLYLWHWPVFVFYDQWRIEEWNGVETAALIGVAFAGAIFSWRYIERPFRHGFPKTQNQVFAAGLGMMALTTIAAGAILAIDGAPSRFSKDVLAVAEGRKDYSPQRKNCHASDRRPIASDALCIYNAPKPASVAVWGDSHTVELAYAVGEALAPHTGVLHASYSRCPAGYANQDADKAGCTRFNQTILETLSTNETINTIVLNAFYRSYYTSGDHEAFEAGFTKVVAALTAAGKTVIIARPTPNYHGGPPHAARLLAFHNQSQGHKRDMDDFTKSIQHAEDFLQSIASDHENVILFDTAQDFCSDGVCRSIDDGVPLFFDAHHMSLSAARRVAARLVQMIDAPASFAQTSNKK